MGVSAGIFIPEGRLSRGPTSKSVTRAGAATDGTYRDIAVGIMDAGTLEGARSLLVSATPRMLGSSATPRDWRTAAEFVAKGVRGVPMEFGHLPISLRIIVRRFWRAASSSFCSRLSALTLYQIANGTIKSEKNKPAQTRKMMTPM
jgi:hypothetical protein